MNIGLKSSQSFGKHLFLHLLFLMIVQLTWDVYVYYNNIEYSVSSRMVAHEMQFLIITRTTTTSSRGNDHTIHHREFSKLLLVSYRLSTRESKLHLHIHTCEHTAWEWSKLSVAQFLGIIIILSFLYYVISILFWTLCIFYYNISICGVVLFNRSYRTSGCWLS